MVPPDVIPGRMALLITLFLVLVNIFNSVTTNTPKAEGMDNLYTIHTIQRNPVNMSTRGQSYTVDSAYSGHFGTGHKWPLYRRYFSPNVDFGT